jgi:hypothetical protein
MALVLKDRVLETCTSPGTGTVTLLGAVTGYQSFSTIGDGNTCYYTIADQSGASWEVGIGTYSSAGTLARTTVLSSSSAGALTNFSSGVQNVFLTYPSSRAVNLSSGALTSGRVVYTTTGGTLTDSANLLYSGTDLSVYGITVGRGNGSVANNIALGASALAGVNTGDGNIGIGTSVLNANTSGTGNTSIGSFSLRFNLSGNYNVALGYNASRGNTSGGNNIAIGQEALYSSTAFSNNIAIGYQALYTANTASVGTTNNLAIGNNAGRLMTSGKNNVILGSFSGNYGPLNIINTDGNIVISDGYGNPRFVVYDQGNSEVYGTFKSGGGISGGTFLEAPSYLSIKNTPISLYYTTSASGVPDAVDLRAGELALNTTDGKLFYKDTAGVVQVLANKGTSGGTFTSISATSITDSGLTSGRVTYASTGGLLADSASFTYNGTNLSVNGATITGGGAQIAGGAWSVIPYVFNSLTIDNASGAARFFATGANSSTYGSYIWYGGLTTGATSEYMTLNTSGNLGLGVTPSTGWYSTAKAIQMGTTGAVFGRDGNEIVGLTSNAYNSAVGTTTYRYIVGGNYATNYLQTTGQHQWFTAGVGTSGGDLISFTQAMTLNASGDLVIGGTTPDVFANTFERNFGVVALTANSTASINVSGTVASRIQFGTGSTRYGLIYQDASNFMQIGTTTALPISFITNSIERMRITSAGNLNVLGNIGIGGQASTATNVPVYIQNAAGLDTQMLLTTVGVNNTVMGFNNTGSTNGQGVPNNTAYFGSLNAYPTAITTNGAVVATFTSTAKFLLGNTDGTQKLAVNGGAFTVNDENSYAASFRNNSIKSVVIGYDTTNNVGHIGSISPGVTWTDLCLLKNGGSVGVGISTPTSKLFVADPGTTLPTGNTSGTGFSVGRADGLIGLSIGYLASNQSSYLQSKNFTNTNMLPLLLNPLGGEVGIGTSTPVATLQIKGSGTSGQVTASFILENSSSGTGGMDITGSAGASRWRFLYGGGPSTGTNALTEAMCIGTEGTNAGRVGIGVTSPSSKLQVVDQVGGLTTVTLGNSVTQDYCFIKAMCSPLASGGYTLFAIQAFSSLVSSNVQVGNFGFTKEGNGTDNKSYFDISTHNGTSLNQGLRITGAGKTIIGSDNTVGTGGDAQLTVNGNSLVVTPNTAGKDTHVLTTGTANYGTYAIKGDTVTKVYLNTNGDSYLTGGNFLVGVTNTAHTSAGFTVESGGVPYTTRASGGTLMGFYDTSAAIIGSITNSGGIAVLYNTTSDQRLKTNIVDAPSGNIDDIKVRSFDWIADGSHQEYGMVAQELLEVAPYAVYQPENSDEMMAVDYSKLVPMMIKEIQDLKQRIATLENK